MGDTYMLYIVSYGPEDKPQALSMNNGDMFLFSEELPAWEKLIEIKERLTATYCEEKDEDGRMKGILDTIRIVPASLNVEQGE
jgi:hypothetical protein